MSRFGAAWFQRVSCFEVRLWWPYDEALLDEFKRLIPHRERKWIAEEKYWSVTGHACDAAERWFYRHFPKQEKFWKSTNGSESTNGSRSSHASSPPPKHDSDWDILYLRNGAPAGLLDVVYHWWCKRAHPDLGGSNQQMQKINAAYDRLRKVAR